MPPKTETPNVWYKQKTAMQICIGPDQRIWKYVHKSANFEASTAIKFVISPIVEPCLAELDNRKDFLYTC